MEPTQSDSPYATKDIIAINEAQDSNFTHHDSQPITYSSPENARQRDSNINESPDNTDQEGTETSPRSVSASPRNEGTQGDEDLDDVQ
jgi:hypothetical protein